MIIEGLKSISNISILTYLPKIKDLSNYHQRKKQWQELVNSKRTNISFYPLFIKFYKNLRLKGKNLLSKKP